MMGEHDVLPLRSLFNVRIVRLGLLINNVPGGGAWADGVFVAHLWGQPLCVLVSVSSFAQLGPQ